MASAFKILGLPNCGKIKFVRTGESARKGSCVMHHISYTTHTHTHTHTHNNFLTILQSMEVTQSSQFFLFCWDNNKKSWSYLNYR